MIFLQHAPSPPSDRGRRRCTWRGVTTRPVRPRSFLALAGGAAVSRLEWSSGLEVQSRCDRRRGRVVASRFRGRAPSFLATCTLRFFLFPSTSRVNRRFLEEPASIGRRTTRRSASLFHRFPVAGKKTLLGKKQAGTSTSS